VRRACAIVTASLGSNPFRIQGDKPDEIICFLIGARALIGYHIGYIYVEVFKK